VGILLVDRLFGDIVLGVERMWAVLGDRSKEGACRMDELVGMELVGKDTMFVNPCRNLAHSVVNMAKTGTCLMTRYYSLW